MARSLLKVQLIASLVGCLILGLMWFYFDLETDDRTVIPQSVKAFALSSISAEKHVMGELAEASVFGVRDSTGMRKSADILQEGVGIKSEPLFLASIRSGPPGAFIVSRKPWIW
jgi:hypothetical protein